VEAASVHTAVEAAPVSTEPVVSSSVEVTATMVHIHDLNIDRAAVVKYLEAIARGKQEIALVHALEVGITEIARRARGKV
jgi:hypothetical protein